MKEPSYAEQTATIRRLFEMAHLYCWGPKGDADKRDEFHQLYDKFHIGEMSYDGGGKFTWKPPTGAAKP